MRAPRRITPSPPPASFPVVLLGIFALALVVRVIHLWQLRNAPVFDMRLGDSAIFDAWARQLAGGDWVGDGVFWYAPLYPYFLGVIYAVFGDDGWLARLVQSVIGAASCVLLADAARRVFSRSAGIAAGLVLALYAPAVFYDGLIQKPVLVLFLLSVVLWIVADRIDGPVTSLPALSLGAAVGLLVLTRENTLAFAPVLLAWMLLTRAPHRSGRALPVMAFVLGLAVVLAPVAARNKIVGGELHLTAANFGDNFYKGNNEHADGWYMPLVALRGSPEFERRDAVEIAERETGRELTPAEVSRYWTGRALEYIRSSPTDWLRLMAQKSLLVWHAAELGDTEDPYTYAMWSAVLWVTLPVFHFGVLAPCALLGIWVTWDRRRSLLPLYLMLAVYPASVVVFYIFGRYRYPVVALLVLFAAAGLTGARKYFREARPAARFACVVTVALALTVANWPTDAKTRVRAAGLYNIGVWLSRQPEHNAEAIEYYESSLALRPESARTLYNLGNALKRQGDLERAEARYREALRHEPGLPEAHNNLARCLESRGAGLDAIASYRRAVATAPSSWLYRSNLALALARGGELEEAEALLREAVRLRPDHAELLFNLGNVLLRNGLPDEAASTFLRALALDPGDARIHNNLGHLLLTLDDLDAAIRSFSEAVRLDPAYGIARRNLDAARAERDRRRGTP